LTEAECQDFGHYARNASLKFFIRATSDVEDLSIECRGIRYGLKEFAPFFAATKAGDKRPIYEQLKAEGLDLPKWTNQDAAAQALHDYENSQPDKLDEIESEDSAYGVAGPASKLRTYLDWMYVPAVKDVADETREAKNSAFSRLILRAVRSKIDIQAQLDQVSAQADQAVDEILAGATAALKEVGDELNHRFRELSSSRTDVGLDWDDAQSVMMVSQPTIRSVIKDGDVVDEPDRFGHGLQRTYLMALLSVVARLGAGSGSSPRLLLGIEEPELYQHPPQARFLADSIWKLTEQGAQVLVSTHSPLFVDARKLNQIKVVRKADGRSKCGTWSVDEQRNYYALKKGEEPIGPDAALSALDRLLQPETNELFFCGKAVVCEGLEDVAILRTYIAQTGRYPDFLRSGGHFISSNGKGSMAQLICIARGFNIPCFFVFDFDSDQQAQDRQNSMLIALIRDLQPDFPDEVEADVASDAFACWKNNIQSSIISDVPEWHDKCVSIAAQWGWIYPRMDKDPMLLERALTEMLQAGSAFPSLEVCAAKLEKFWTT
jgi:predicted ATP-dependent endonuclease of OLD family